MDFPDYSDFRMAEYNQPVGSPPPPQNSTQPSPSAASVPETQGSANRPPLTVDDILAQPGRHRLPRLDPEGTNGAMWFGNTNSKIRKSVLRMIHGLVKIPYTKFSEVTDEEKDLWFRTFAQDFNWDSSLSKEVEKLFMKEANTQYTRHVSEWKKKWLQGSVEPPKGCNKNVWLGLQQHWMKVTTAKVAQKNAKNRKSDRGGKGMAVHNSGAKSFTTREEELTAKAGGVCPDLLQMMEVTHTNKKTGEIQDPVIADLVVNLKKKKEEKLAALSQDSSQSSINFGRDEVNRLVLEETPFSHGRYLGLGNLTQSSSSTYTGGPWAQLEESRKEIADNRREIAENRAEMEESKKKLAELERQNEEMKAFFKLQFSNFPG